MIENKQTEATGSNLWRIWNRCPARLQSVLRSTALFYYKRLCSSRTFVLNGRDYHYFYHGYHSTWANERSVEIPIALSYVEENIGRNILEVGNVLSHYFPVDHDVLDKYEKGTGIINSDIVAFSPSKKYDLILSISTLEHIGFDEDLPEPDKVLRAIENMVSLLATGGLMLATIPLGYNPHIERLLNTGRIRFTEMRSLKRISRDNRWVETDFEDIKGSEYNSPYPCANGLIVGIIRKDIDVPTHQPAE